MQGVKVYTAHRIRKLAYLLWILLLSDHTQEVLTPKGKSINTNPQSMYTCQYRPIPPKLDRICCTLRHSQHYHITESIQCESILTKLIGTTVLAHLSLERSFSKHRPVIFYLLSTSCHNLILYVNWANDRTNKSPLILSFCTQELLWNHLREIAIVPKIRKHCNFWFHKDT